MVIRAISFIIVMMFFYWLTGREGLGPADRLLRNLQKNIKIKMKLIALFVIAASLAFVGCEKKETMPEVPSTNAVPAVPAVPAK